MNTISWNHTAQYLVCIAVTMLLGSAAVEAKELPKGGKVVSGKAKLTVGDEGFIMTAALLRNPKRSRSSRARSTSLKCPV